MLKRYDAPQKILGSQEELCSLEALMALREPMPTRVAYPGTASLINQLRTGLIVDGSWLASAWR